MADLSHLLGDVYGETAPAPPDEGPAWADESRLDELFTAAEPEYVAVVAPPAPAALGQPLDDDLAAALSAALADVPEAAVPLMAPRPEPTPASSLTSPEATTVSAPVMDAPTSHDSAPPARRAWQPSDDEILPGRPRSAAQAPRGRLRVRPR